MAEKKNISSGADKAEKLTRKHSQKNTESAEAKELKNLSDNGDGAEKNTAKAASGAKKAKRDTAPKRKAENKTAKKADKRSSSKRNTKKAKHKKPISEKRAQKIKQREEKRLERKKLAAERKQKRLERKLEHKEKRAERIALMKEKRAERREARAERRDLIKHESREAKRERIAEEKRAKREAAKAKHEKRLAEKKAKREHALKVRAQKQAQKRDNRQSKDRTPGYGGWLAAVISLGVTTLALATIVTFGWINMDQMQSNMAGGYTQSLYELNAIVDDLDANLARARASSSTGDRVKVFTDIAVESENAELVLERFPLEIQTTERLSSFINDMGRDAKSMLYTVANGGELSARQIEELNYLYETNAKVKSELNKLIENTCENDMLAAMRGKDCALSDSFTVIQNNVFGEESQARSKRKPHSPALLEGGEEISASKAESIAKDLFGDYEVSDAHCTGEAAGRLPLFNVNLTVPDGEMLVQISKVGGKVVSFDSFKDCAEHNFSVERCVDIAEDFLNKVGYDGLKAVWASENGTTCNLHFAPIQGGAVIYSDLVRVKVCEERGIVTGMEASSYVLRHRDRDIGSPAISEDEAKSSINGNIEVSSTRTAVIPFMGKDRLCYEFFGQMDGVDYYCYVDAQTGEELEVRTVIGTAQGNIIR